MIKVGMTLQMRAKVAYTPCLLTQETVDDQVTWQEISDAVALSVEEKTLIGLEEQQDSSGNVRGAAWQPLNDALSQEKEISLETSHARFLLNFLKTARMFSRYDLPWVQELIKRLKMVL